MTQSEEENDERVTPLAGSMSSVNRCVIHHRMTASRYSPSSAILEGWRGVDRGRVPRSEHEMARKPVDQSADILARLNATGLLPALEAAKTTSRITKTRRSSARTVSAKPASTVRHYPISPIQRQALGTTPITSTTAFRPDSPQSWTGGDWQLSNTTTPGRTVIEQGVMFRAVHITFPEWV